MSTDTGIDFLTKTGARTINTPQRAEAAQIVAAFGRYEEKCRTSTNLTPLAQQRAIAVAWKKAKTHLADLQAAEDKELADREAFIERSLFGHFQPGAGPDHTMAVRDAKARAAQIDSPVAAEAAMISAGRDGDRTLVRAIADRAYKEGWSEVVLQTYVGIHPEVAAQVNELATLNDHHAGAGSPQAAIGKAMSYGLPTPPGFSENQLLGLAAEAANTPANGSAV